MDLISTSNKGECTTGESCSLYTNIFTGNPIHSCSTCIPNGLKEQKMILSCPPGIIEQILHEIRTGPKNAENGPTGHPCLINKTAIQKLVLNNTYKYHIISQPVAHARCNLQPAACDFH